MDLNKNEARKAYHLLNYNTTSKELVQLTHMPNEEADPNLVVSSSSPYSQLNGFRVPKYRLNFKKDAKDATAIWIELWERSGLRYSKKAPSLGLVYNDPVFGGISWSRDERKVAFIGQRPEEKQFKSHFADPEEQKTKEEKKEEEKNDETGEDTKKKEEKKEKGMEDKFLYKPDFGETLTGKTDPLIYVLDVQKGTLETVLDLPANVYPGHPIFDPQGEGLIFTGYKLPGMKLGLNICLNRPTSLFYATELRKDEKAEGKTKVVCLTEQEYLAIAPRFNENFS